MVNKIYLNSRFALRSDTLDNWQSKNPVLEDGEPSVVSNGSETEWLKIGDGVTDWNNLPYKLGPMGPQGVQGNKGEKGDKGDKGSDGLTPETDQTYNPESTNAQSGIAVAEGIAQLDLKGYEVIDDITISEGVTSVVFSNSSQKDYTEFFLICSMGVATDGKLQCAIKMNGGNTYLAWKQLNASAKTTENYLWWHYAKYIGKTGVQNNKNQYAWISQFPDASITTQDGGIITQGISSNNKSQYCDISNSPVGNKSENYEISSVGGSSAFASGSRFILLGRGTRQ